MSDKIDFKDLYVQQTANPPKMEEIHSKFAKLKQKNLIKLIFANLMLTITILAIISIWIYFKPQFTTTKIGIILILLGILIYLSVYNQLIPHLRKIDKDQSNQDFLKTVVRLKRKTIFLQTTMMSFYFIMLTLGICLYTYEYAVRMTITWQIVVYGVTSGWLGFNWFYLRPIIIRKERKKLDDIIEKFEDVKS